MKKLLVLAALTLSTTFATTIAMTTSGGAPIANDEESFTSGWSFSIADPIVITSLGYYDANDQDGLADDHEVGIFDSSTGTLLVSVTVPSGTGGTLNNGFRMVSITPYSLTAGTYTIGGFSNFSTDAVLIGSSFVTDPAITIVDGGLATFDPSLAMPTLSDGQTTVASVNFEFDAETPEPSTMLLSLGAFAALGLKKRFSKQA